MCTKIPRPPASMLSLGLQAFPSLPNLAEETVLTVSPHPCGTARAGSVLTAGRELNAHLRTLAMVTVSHRRELGGFAFAASHFQTRCFFLRSGWTVRSYAVPWDPSLRLAQNTTPAPLAYRASAPLSLEMQGGKAGHMAQMPQVHLPSVSQGNTGPTSSARSQDLPGSWDGGTCFRNPHDPKGFSVSL